MPYGRTVLSGYFTVPPAVLHRVDAAHEVCQCVETALTLSFQQTNAPVAQALIGATGHPRRWRLRCHFRREWPSAARSAS
jgi:hypothetical protein